MAMEPALAPCGVWFVVCVYMFVCIMLLMHSFLLLRKRCLGFCSAGCSVYLVFILVLRLSLFSCYFSRGSVLFVCVWFIKFLVVFVCFVVLSVLRCVIDAFSVVL